MHGSLHVGRVPTTYYPATSYLPTQLPYLLVQRGRSLAQCALVHVFPVYPTYPVLAVWAAFGSCNQP